MIALTGKGAPSLVLVVGAGNPRSSMWRRTGSRGLAVLVADRQMQQVLAAVGGDAQADQQRLHGAVPAQPLEPRIDEDVPHLNAGQVAGVDAW